jgi:hypothetical protein
MFLVGEVLERIAAEIPDKSRKRKTRGDAWLFVVEHG